MQATRQVWGVLTCPLAVCRARETSPLGRGDSWQRMHAHQQWCLCSASGGCEGRCTQIITWLLSPALQAWAGWQRSCDGPGQSVALGKLSTLKGRLLHLLAEIKRAQLCFWCFVRPLLTGIMEGTLFLKCSFRPIKLWLIIDYIWISGGSAKMIHIHWVNF